MLLEGFFTTFLLLPGREVFNWPLLQEKLFLGARAYGLNIDWEQVWDQWRAELKMLDATQFWKIRLAISVSVEAGQYEPSMHYVLAPNPLNQMVIKTAKIMKREWHQDLYFSFKQPTYAKEFLLLRQWRQHNSPYNEILWIDQYDNCLETTTQNIFLREFATAQWITPGLEKIYAGVMRQKMLEFLTVGTPIPQKVTTHPVPLKKLSGGILMGTNSVVLLSIVLVPELINYEKGTNNNLSKTKLMEWQNEVHQIKMDFFRFLQHNKSSLQSSGPVLFA